jgi:hypothetical protein
MSLGIPLLIIGVGACATFLLARRYNVAGVHAIIIAAVGTVTSIGALSLEAQTQISVPTPQIAVQQFTVDQARHLAIRGDHPSGNVDSYDSGSYDRSKRQIISRPASSLLTGWAAQTDRGETGSGIILLVDGKVAQVGTYGGDRPDVETHYNNTALRYCGFSIYTPKLSPGVHRLGFGLIDKNGSGYSLVDGMPTTLWIKS